MKTTNPCSLALSWRWLLYPAAVCWFSRVNLVCFQPNVASRCSTWCQSWFEVKYKKKKSIWIWKENPNCENFCFVVLWYLEVDFEMPFSFISTMCFDISKWVLIILIIMSYNTNMMKKYPYWESQAKHCHTQPLYRASCFTKCSLANR